MEGPLAVRAERPADGWSLPAARPRARTAARVPLGALGAVIAGLLAFLLILVGTGDRRKSVYVAMAARDIPAGQVVTPADLRRVALPADSPLVASLVGIGVNPSDGLVASHPIAQGAPIAKTDLVASAARAGLRAMSLPVPAERAVGGDLKVGDRVDVIDSSSDPATYVAAGLEVLSVSSTISGTLGSAGPNHVTVAVDANNALALAGGLARGKVDVIRSTGATTAAAASPATTATVTAGKPAKAGVAP